MRRTAIHPVVWAFALALAASVTIFISVPNYHECREAGFSARYCAKAFIR